MKLPSVGGCRTLCASVMWYCHLWRDGFVGPRTITMTTPSASGYHIWCNETLSVRVLRRIIMESNFLVSFRMQWNLTERTNGTFGTMHLCWYRMFGLRGGMKHLLGGRNMCPCLGKVWPKNLLQGECWWVCDILDGVSYFMMTFYPFGEMPRIWFTETLYLGLNVRKDWAWDDILRVDSWTRCDSRAVRRRWSVIYWFWWIMEVYRVVFVWKHPWCCCVSSGIPQIPLRFWLGFDPPGLDLDRSDFDRCWLVWPGPNV